MPVASLSVVQIRAKRSEIGTILAKLINFRNFDPATRGGLTQDIEIVLLSSRFFAVYSKAADLLSSDTLRLPKEMERAHSSTKPEKFDVSDLNEFVEFLSEELETARKFLPLYIADEDKKGLSDFLKAIKDLALAMFNNLSRILVVPGSPPGFLTLEGYVPSNSIGKLERDFGSHIVNIRPISKWGKQDPYVPSLLVNPRVVSLFENLSLMKGMPKYNEVDPTPIVALIFPFFFGLMFGDVGHGVVLLAFGIYLLKETKYDYWGKLITVLGSAAVAFGFVRGSFFGLEFTSPIQGLVTLPQFFSSHFTLVLIPLLLEIAIIIGTFHLASAYAIGFVNALRSSEFADAFLDRLPTLTLYCSIVPLGLAFIGAGFGAQDIFESQARTPVFYELLGLYVPVSLTATISTVIVICSIAVLLLGLPILNYLSSNRRARRAIRSLGSSGEVTVARPFEFFMNTVSYARLGVLLILTTLLGRLISGFLSFGVLGALLAVFLNIALIGLEGLIVYIQDMRLHLYEWMPKFYSGSGKPFTPFSSRAESFELNFISNVGLEIKNRM